MAREREVSRTEETDEERNLEKLYFLLKYMNVSVLLKVKMLECTWSCIFIQTECVRCILEGHWISVQSLRDVRYINL